MVEAGFFDEARFDHRPTNEFLNDDFPTDGNPRWVREWRIMNVKRVAKGYDPM
jgi:hypothetical protein